MEQNNKRHSLSFIKKALKKFKVASNAKNYLKEKLEDKCENRPFSSIY
jgi:hypothetical protein